jgi:hypothetical protein
MRAKTDVHGPPRIYGVAPPDYKQVTRSAAR